jgi:hypothetical protein
MPVQLSPADVSPEKLSGKADLFSRRQASGTRLFE